MSNPNYLDDYDDENRLPLCPPGTRKESHKDSFFSDHVEHQLFYGPVQKLVNELYNAGPLDGPGDALERLKKIQRIKSMLEAQSATLMADSVEQIDVSFGDTLATQYAHTEEEERAARQSAEYYGVDRGSDQTINSNFVAEAAVALRETTQKVYQRMFISKGLRHVCKATLMALAAGDITVKSAHNIVKFSQDLTPEQISRMEAMLLPMAKTASDDAVYQRARRFHDRMNPESAERRHNKSMEARKVRSWATANGMGCLKFTGSIVDIKSIMSTAEFFAEQNTDPKDLRTRDQLVADVFADAMINGWPGTDGTPLKPRVSITIPAVEMLADRTRTLAELEGHGPIPLGVALNLVKDAPSFQRVLTDPWSGAAIDVEPKRYRPSQGLKDLLRHRDQHCCFPGCRRPADRSEIDHVDAFSKGGHTDRANTQLLCKQHQMFKHALGWKVIASPDGAKSWITPHGLRSIVVPESVQLVNQFEHVHDHCPQRPTRDPAPAVNLTPDVRRVLSLDAEDDFADDLWNDSEAD